MAEKSLYWADQIADKIIKERGKKKIYTIASGISPSGTIHIGNFREEMTVELVRRALVDKGYKVRYIHSWDNFDRYRKVPGNVPDSWKQHVGKALSKIPDPWKCHKSYAEHFEKEFEKSAKVVGVEPEYLNQTKIYESSTYKEGIKEAMLKRDLIKEILNKFRKENLEENWYPVQIYCEICGTDATKVTGYDGKYTVSYDCACGNASEINFSKQGNLKLRWRVDWSMRWKFYEEDFEPGGKEHSTPGGSRDTSKIIAEDVYDYNAPIYQMYDYIGVKGQGGKMSGSKGNVPSVADLNKIYMPEVVRYLYAGTRPKTEFAIALEDEEVFKTYEDFYFAERVYYGKEKLDDKKTSHWKRVYEMSNIKKIPKKMPVQLPFKYMVMLAQFYKEDSEIITRLKLTEHIKESDEKDPRIKVLIKLARSWAKNFAPSGYIYEIQEKRHFELSSAEKDAVKILVEKETLDESTLYEIGKVSGLGGSFFKLCYKILLNKERGPRLYELINIIGINKVKEIFEKYL